jgi:hypothetical protein
MRPELEVWDDVVPDPVAYRAAALALPFGSVTVGAQTFHGIALAPAWATDALTPWFDDLTLSLFRLSPAGQVEPTFIHADGMMGAWTAILYLNPDPPAGDGTSFWRHKATGAIESGDDGLLDQRPDGADPATWERWQTVPAAWNRLVRFPSAWWHSRALVANYGATVDTARLIHVSFGGVPIWP